MTRDKNHDTVGYFAFQNVVANVGGNLLTDFFQPIPCNAAGELPEVSQFRGARDVS